MRGSRVLVICPEPPAFGLPRLCPAVGADRFLFTFAHCVWLKTLKNSKRSCNRALSVKLKFLNSDISQLLIPGPRRKLRRTVPKLPSAGRAKIPGLNHVGFWPAGTLCVWFVYVELPPIKSGRILPPVPLPRLPLDLTSIGFPLQKRVIPVHSQPPAR